MLHCSAEDRAAWQTISAISGSLTSAGEGMMAPAGISVAVLAEALPGPAAMTSSTSKYLRTPPARGESAAACVGKCCHRTHRYVARRCLQLDWLAVCNIDICNTVCCPAVLSLQVSGRQSGHLKPDRFGVKSVAGFCRAQDPQFGVAPAPDASCRPLQAGTGTAREAGHGRQR
jgi:hypothetical protein